MSTLLKKIYQKLKAKPDPLDPKTKSITQRMRKLFKKKNTSQPNAAQDKPALKTANENQIVSSQLMSGESTQSMATKSSTPTQEMKTPESEKSAAISNASEQLAKQKLAAQEKLAKSADEALDYADLGDDEDEDLEDESLDEDMDDKDDDLDAEDENQDEDLDEDEDEDEDLYEDEDEDEDLDEDVDEDEDLDEDVDEEHQDLTEDIIVNQYRENLIKATKDLSQHELAQLTTPSQVASPKLTAAVSKINLNLNETKWSKAPLWEVMQVLSENQDKIISKAKITNTQLMDYLREYGLLFDMDNIVVLTTYKNVENNNYQANIEKNLILFSKEEMQKRRGTMCYYSLECIAQYNGMPTIISVFETHGSVDESLLRLRYSYNENKNPMVFLMLAMFVNLFKGMQQIHASGFLHLNIAAHHVLVDQKYQAKLANFSHIERIDSQNKDAVLQGHFLMGKWMDQDRLQGSVDRASDLFALKMCMLEMIAYAAGMPESEFLGGLCMVDLKNFIMQKGNNSAISWVKYQIKTYLLRYQQSKLFFDLLILLNVFDDFFAWDDEVKLKASVHLQQAEDLFKLAYHAALSEVKTNR